MAHLHRRPQLIQAAETQIFSGQKTVEAIWLWLQVKPLFLVKMELYPQNISKPGAMPPIYSTIWWSYRTYGNPVVVRQFILAHVL